MTDWLGVLHLREETLVLALVGGAPSTGSEMHDDFNNEASVLYSEQTLCSNPAVSNMHVVIYYLPPIIGRDRIVCTATTIPPVPLWPRVPRGRVRSGAPKDTSVAPSHIQIHGNGELCSHHFPQTPR